MKPLILSPRLWLFGACAALLAAAATPTWAQTATPEIIDEAPPTASICHSFARLQQDDGPRIIQARYAPDLGEEQVAITFIDHATVVIESPKGVTAATDYAGSSGAVSPPTIVTMNRASEGHYTSFVREDVKHVLKGWGDALGQPAGRDITEQDMRVRSVSTHYRASFGAAARFGNSIFVFEVAGLCIGHLGHLHHEPTNAMYGALGTLDVVIAPVDGGLTLDLPTMITVLKKLKARLVIPVHYFSLQGLRLFADGMSDEFKIETNNGSTTIFSKATLPKEPTVLLLPPVYGLELE